MGKTAIIFGATGLVGNLLPEELIRTGNYSSIRIFVRRTTEISESGKRIVESDELQRIAGK